MFSVGNDLVITKKTGSDVIKISDYSTNGEIERIIFNGSSSEEATKDNLATWLNQAGTSSAPDVSLSLC